jgi:hypothetical protein
MGWRDEGTGGPAGAREEAIQLLEWNDQAAHIIDREKNAFANLHIFPGKD